MILKKIHSLSEIMLSFLDESFSGLDTFLTATVSLVEITKFNLSKHFSNQEFLEIHRVMLSFTGKLVLANLWLLVTSRAEFVHSLKQTMSLLSPPMLIVINQTH